MTKIGIPVCEDTLFNALMTGMIIMLIGALSFLTFLVLVNGGLMLILVPLVFTLKIVMFEFILMLWDKESMIGKINPFKLTGDCKT
jgi:hypothetical protein